MDLADLAPLATLAVAGVALVVGLVTLRQRDLADRREQWWERFRWASELTLGQDQTSRALGLEVLDLLSSSRLASPEDLDVLEAGLTAALELRTDLLDDVGGVEEDGRADSDHDDG